MNCRAKKFLLKLLKNNYRKEKNNEAVLRFYADTLKKDYLCLLDCNNEREKKICQNLIRTHKSQIKHWRMENAKIYDERESILFLLDKCVEADEK